jgi:hypothetical protein
VARVFVEVEDCFFGEEGGPEVLVPLFDLIPDLFHFEDVLVSFVHKLIVHCFDFLLELEGRKLEMPTPFPGALAFFRYNWNQPVILQVI